MVHNSACGKPGADTDRSARTLARHHPPGDVRPGRRRSVRQDDAVTVLPSDDARLLLDELAAFTDVLDADRFAASVVTFVRRLVPCDVATINVVDPARGTTVYRADPADFAVPRDGGETLARLAGEHPLVSHIAATGDGSAARLSDRVAVAEFERTELFRSLYAPMGVRYQLACALPAAPPVVIGVVASRRDADFTDREVGLLEAARPFLAQIWRLCSERQATPPGQGPPEFGFTPREAQVAEALRDGFSNDEIGRRLNIGAETVKTHVRRVYDKLGVSTRAQAVARLHRPGR
jgi:DNA-binding CsgD family transcriptional regulator